MSHEPQPSTQMNCMNIGKLILLSVSVFLGIGVSFASGSNQNSADETKEVVRLTFQKKYRELPEISLITTKEDVGFQVVDMSNTITKINGKKYCAFRFSTEDTLNPFVWCFRRQPTLTQWEIIRAQGPMYGFDYHHSFKLDKEKENWGSKNDFFYIQALAARLFSPNQGYAIWFEIEHEEDAVMYLSINMMPMKGQQYEDVFTDYRL